MVKITVSDNIKTVCPQFQGAAIWAKIENQEHSEDLWKEINEFTETIAQSKELSDVKKNLNIETTRNVYKLLGKDPNRYRPSAESLQRRILRGIPLYEINNAVDLINLVSLKTGYCIDGFDFNKISGDSLLLAVGEKDDIFEGIGRGLLNIEGLPVYRDLEGGIGTPTSDEERTKLSIDTKVLLMLINGYSGEKGLRESIDYSIRLLQDHVSATEIKTWFY